MGKNKIFFLLCVFMLTLFMSGCVFGPSENAGSGAIDPPQEDYLGEGVEEGDIEFNLSETEGEGDTESAEEETAGEEAEGEQENSAEDEADSGEDQAQSTERTIYVFDDKGYVVPLTVQVPFTESPATQAMEYLVAGGPVTELLPDGTRAVLPAGTELSVNIIEDEKTAVVDFSKEFGDYPPEDEKGILEAITWTLTQFDSIDKVNIMMNGEPLEVMPVNETPIQETLSRQDGINIEIGSGARIGDNSVVTLYFKSESPSGAYDYYVPVSRVIPRSNDLLLATVEELIKGPSPHSGLFTDLSDKTEVLEAQEEDGLVTLDFSEEFLSFDSEDTKASDDVLNSLVLSLAESGLADAVQVSVNGETDLETLGGLDLSKPVSKPVTINAAGI